MRKLLFATIAAVAVSASAHAERKRDILGFSPGMSYQDAMSAAAKICKSQVESWIVAGSGLHVKCYLAPRQVTEFDRSAARRVMRNEELELDFAHSLPGRPLLAVSYLFYSDAEDAVVVNSVFEQYGFTCDRSRPGHESFCYPTKEMKEIHYLGGIETYGPTTGYKAELLLDPPANQWWQVDHGISLPIPGLWLTLKKYNGVFTGMFNWDQGDASEGRLTLSDDRISKTRQTARQSDVPPPKF
jgi:hypothetical protein